MSFGLVLEGLGAAVTLTSSSTVRERKIPIIYLPLLYTALVHPRAVKSNTHSSLGVAAIIYSGFGIGSVNPNEMRLQMNRDPGHHKALHTILFVAHSVAQMTDRDAQTPPEVPRRSRLNH